MRSPALPIAVTAALLGAVLRAQDPQADCGYPERDILSPFRQCEEVYAPPDAVYERLAIMRARALDPATRKSFDSDGREIVDDASWRRAHQELQRLPLDAGYLAEILRRSKNADDRDLALYGMFFVSDVAHVCNLIGHIPGEPVRKAREAALPRAVEYLRVHLPRRYGDLTDEQKQALDLPEPGSPAAKAMGITRAPRDEDHLFAVRLQPFFQLLDARDEIDQAQGLWFLTEVFRIRRDLALFWLEPALPRLRQLLGQGGPQVREQVLELMRVIGPKDLPEAPTDDPRALQLWFDRAAVALFPPIRVVNDALVQLQPCPERDAIAAKGRQALAGDSIGDAVDVKQKDGTWVRGFRVAHVPDELAILQIPAGAIITNVNGVPVRTSRQLLETVERILQSSGHPRKLIVEYVHKEQAKACEYRVL